MTRPSTLSRWRIEWTSDRCTVNWLIEPSKIDVGIHWRFLVLPHQIVKSRRVAVRFNDPRLHHDVHAIRPLAGDLQLLGRIAIELVSVPEKTSRCAGGPGSRQVLWVIPPGSELGHCLRPGILRRLVENPAYRRQRRRNGGSVGRVRATDVAGRRRADYHSGFVGERERLLQRPARGPR